MTTSPTPDRMAVSPADVLADVLRVVLGLALLLVLGFVACFIVPKVEVQYLSIGLRPPLALECVFAISHFCVNYFWLFVACGGLMLILARNPAPRGDRPAS